MMKAFLFLLATLSAIYIALVNIMAYSSERGIALSALLEGGEKKRNIEKQTDMLKAIGSCKEH